MKMGACQCSAIITVQWAEQCSTIHHTLYECPVGHGAAGPSDSPLARSLPIQSCGRFRMDGGVWAPCGGPGGSPFC